MLRGVRFTFLGWSLSLESGEMNGLDGRVLFTDPVVLFGLVELAQRTS